MLAPVSGSACGLTSCYATGSPLQWHEPAPGHCSSTAEHSTPWRGRYDVCAKVLGFVHQLATSPKWDPSQSVGHDCFSSHIHNVINSCVL